MFGENVILSARDQVRVSDYLSKVYGWMAAALVISAGVAWQISSTPQFINYLMTHSGLFYLMLIVQFVLVIALSGWVNRMSFAGAILSFLLYSAITGMTLSTIFLVYTTASIFKTFITTAGLFGMMSVYGLVTKKDLSSWGSFLFMSLLGIILASLVNLFLHSYMIEWITTYAGIIIFTGLAAYDVQKLKAFGMAGFGEANGNMAIYGALVLYLDFINLFLHLLRAMGKRR